MRASDGRVASQPSPSASAPMVGSRTSLRLLSQPPRDSQSQRWAGGFHGIACGPPRQFRSVHCWIQFDRSAKAQERHELLSPFTETPAQYVSRKFRTGEPESTAAVDRGTAVSWFALIRSFILGRPRKPARDDARPRPSRTVNNSLCVGRSGPRSWSRPCVGSHRREATSDFDAFARL